MKRWTALMLAVCMILGCTALAEETAAETAVQEETADENAFRAWFGQEMETVSDALSTGWEKAGEAISSGLGTASDAVTSGIGWIGEKAGEWIGQAEAYLQEHQWNEKVKSAWETLKAGAQNAGSAAQESLDEAYRTVREWLVQNSDEVDRNVAAAVDYVADAAGVVKARLAEWYRMMTAFLAEKADAVTEAVVSAWNTITEFVSETGNVTGEALSRACETMRSWLHDLGESDDSETVGGLDILISEEAESAT